MPFSTALTLNITEEAQFCLFTKLILEKIGKLGPLRKSRNKFGAHESKKDPHFFFSFQNSGIGFQILLIMLGFNEYFFVVVPYHSHFLYYIFQQLLALRVFVGGGETC